MNIWLINPYGALPGEAWKENRFSVMAKVLADSGHKIIWWTSTWSHNEKKYRAAYWKDNIQSENYLIRLVPTPSYFRHISVKRFWFEIVFAVRVYFRGTTESMPDCIVATERPQSVGLAAERLSFRLRIPLIYDIMDMWPELFVLALPNLLKPLHRFVFFPLYALRKRNLGKADALTALSRTYLDYILSKIPKAKKLPSAVIYNGVSIGEFRNRNVCNNGTCMIKKADELWAIYAGTIGNNYDIECLVSAARILAKKRRNIKIIVAGHGPLKNLIIKYLLEDKSGNLVYLEVLNPGELICLYKSCDIGICAYGIGSNVEMPDKAYDYMAAGLPIISSIRGELAEHINRLDIGLNYLPGNANSLVSKIEELADNTEKRKQMAQRSLKNAAIFDIHTQFNQIVKLVNELSSEGCRKGKRILCLPN